MLPRDGTVLLEEALQGTATGTAIQPNGYVVLPCRVTCGKEPEEELTVLVLVDGNREETGVGLPNVEVNFGNSGAVHTKLWKFCHVLGTNRLLTR